MLADCKLKEEAVAAGSIISAIWQRISTLTAADPSEYQVEIENLVEVDHELTKKRIRLLREAALVSPGREVVVDSEGRSQRHRLCLIDRYKTKICQGRGLWFIVPVSLPLRQACCTYRFS